MAQRNIAEEEIEEALANITHQAPSEDDPDNRTVIHGTTGNGRRLMIVVESADSGYVITVAER